MDFFKQKFSADALLEGQVFLIDKPLGWTSFQVVNKMRWHLKKLTGLKKLKVGHAGTLDPLATGLLLVCTGKKTKSINTLQGQEKTYTGIFTLGATTPSYDCETAIDNRFPTSHLNENNIKKTALKFKGVLQQYPPLFSAIKKEGKRLYEIARLGNTTELEARKITVHKFEINGITLPEINFLIKCSKGTYIRSIAHDFGKALQSGAYLSALKRTQIGPYKLNDALNLNSALESFSEKNIRSVHQAKK